MVYFPQMLLVQRNILDAMYFICIVVVEHSAIFIILGGNINLAVYESKFGFLKDLSNHSLDKWVQGYCNTIIASSLISRG